MTSRARDLARLGQETYESENVNQVPTVFVPPPDSPCPPITDIMGYQTFLSDIAPGNQGNNIPPISFYSKKPRLLHPQKLVSANIHQKVEKRTANSTAGSSGPGHTATSSTVKSTSGRPKASKNSIPVSQKGQNKNKSKPRSYSSVQSETQQNNIAILPVHKSSQKNGSRLSGSDLLKENTTVSNRATEITPAEVTSDATVITPAEAAITDLASSSLERNSFESSILLPSSNEQIQSTPDAPTLPFKGHNEIQRRNVCAGASQTASYQNVNSHMESDNNDNGSDLTPKEPTGSKSNSSTNQVHRRRLEFEGPQSSSVHHGADMEPFEDDPELLHALQMFEKSFPDPSRSEAVLLAVPDSPEPSPMSDESAPTSANTSFEPTKKRNVAKRSDTRVRSRNPSKWATAIRKAAYDSGIEHKTAKNTIRKARSMGPGCRHYCKKKCTARISHADRQKVFNDFWSLKNHVRQWDFVNRHMKCKKPPKTKNPGQKYSKGVSRSYFFVIDSAEVFVCRSMFLSTLNISYSWIRTAWKKVKGKHSISPDKRGKHSKAKNPDFQSKKISAEYHIRKFKTVPSHFTRARSKRKYLESGLSVNKMYRMYCSWMAKRRKDQPVASLRMYRDIFNTKFNYSFHMPKKDQCGLCRAYLEASPNLKVQLEAKYQQHQKNKQLARDLKQKDKEESLKSNKTVCFACFDLQKLLLCPKSEVGEVYYLSKLKNFNLTVYNGTSHKAYCFVWNETEGKRGANEIASALWQFFLISVEQGIKEFRLWADNCSGQNKNKYLFSLLAIAAAKLNIKIYLRFLEVGHTQNEGDSVHAQIEREAKDQDIFVPEEWHDVIKRAKREGHPYSVVLMKDKIYDFYEIGDKQLNWTHKAIAWKGVREVVFDSANVGKVCVRSNFEEKESREIDIMKKCKGRPLNLSKIVFQLAYDAPIPLKAAKAAALVKACNNLTIPQKYHAQYQALPGFPQIRLKNGLVADEGDISDDDICDISSVEGDNLDEELDTDYEDMVEETAQTPQQLLEQTEQEMDQEEGVPDVNDAPHFAGSSSEECSDSYDDLDM